MKYLFFSTKRKLSMDIANQLIAVFCEIDDFCKEFNKHAQLYLLNGSTKGKRGPACALSTSEIMTILVLFQMIQFRDFKTFYKGFLSIYWQTYFPNLPRYNRFVELINRAIFPLTLFTELKSGKRTGIYYIDSSCLPVCHLKRQRRHKTFKSIAEFGRTSVSWFFGLKLHLVTNNKGELMALKITKGNRQDGKAIKPLLVLLQGLAWR